MVHEGAVIAGGQRDLLVAELQLQAAVEEAEQDVVGQAQGAVAVLSVLCTPGKNKPGDANTVFSCPGIQLQRYNNCMNCKDARYLY